MDNATNKQLNGLAVLITVNVLLAVIYSLPSAMLLLGASTPVDLPTPLLAELLLLNGILGLVAGERLFREGLVAAIGVHFWVDIVWHVIYPAFS